MAKEVNKIVVVQVINNLFKKHKTELMDRWIDPQIVAHIPRFSACVRGIKEYRQFIDDIHEAFPNATINTDDIIAEGDRVTTRWSIRGMCKNDSICPMAGYGTTTLYLISIFRLANNRVIEYWQLDTGFSLMPDF